MPLLTRKKILLTKQEATYNTAPALSLASDLVLIRNLSIEPLNAEFVSRDIIRSHMGSSDGMVVAKHVTMNIETELAGFKGATGAYYAPLNDLLLSCGMAATTVAGTSVTYNPVTEGMKSVACALNWDGTRHLLTGGRSNMKVSLKQGELPTFSFDVTGNFNPHTVEFNPGTPNYDGFKKPVPVINGNTTVSLFGDTSLKLLGCEIDMGNSVEVARYANAPDEVIITDRKVTAKLSVESDRPDVRSYINQLLAQTEGVFMLTHGNAVGNKVSFTANGATIVDVGYSDNKGRQVTEVSLALTPKLGNDDLIIKFF